MRVLHISSGNMYGGVETFLATLAREANAAPGMESEFALCFDGRLSTELERLGGALHRLGRVRLSRPHTIARARRVLREVIRHGAYDVVVCHQPWTCVVFASAVKAAGLPLVLWVHMAGDGRHWLERICRVTRPDLAICNSEFSVSRNARWLHRVPIERVHYPLSLSRTASDWTPRAAVRRELDTPPDDVVVIQVSRLEAWKGQRVLLRSLGQIRDLNGWTCWIVGGPQTRGELSYLRRLEADTRQYGIQSRVRFLGERRDVPDLLAAADVFCQANVSPEPFGLSLVEALHTGLPVITSGVGGAVEIVDGSCGILTPPGDSAAVASALRRLITDRDLAACMSVEARRRPDQICNVPRQMRRIQHVLASALTPRPASGHLVETDLG